MDMEAINIDTEKLIFKMNVDRPPFDNDKADELIGKRVLIGITYVDSNNNAGGPIVLIVGLILRDTILLS